MTAPAIPVFPGRHGNAGNIVAGWRLPLIFQNPQFIVTLADALQRSKAAVEGERMVRGRYMEQGVVIRRKGGGSYYIATSPPSSDVLRGLEQIPGAFAGGLRPVTGAHALVIALPPYIRNEGIIDGHYGLRLTKLASRMRLPVIVASARSDTWVVVPGKGITRYQWRRLVK